MALNQCEQGTVHTLYRHGLGHSDAVGPNHARRCLTATLVNSIGYQDLITGYGRVNCSLNGYRSRCPVGVGRRRAGAVHIHIAYRRRGVDCENRQESDGKFEVVSLCHGAL